MKYVFVILMVFGCITCKAQVKYPVKKGSPTNPLWTRIEKAGMKPIYASIFFFGKSDIESYSPAGRNYGKRLFKIKGDTIGIVARVKPGVELVSMDDMVKLYKIPAKYRRLHVVVDGVYEGFPDDIYAVKSAIKYVKVDYHPVTKERVIYIVTVAAFNAGRAFKGDDY